MVSKTTVLCSSQSGPATKNIMARLKINFRIGENSILKELAKTFREIQWPTLKDVLIKTLVVLVISAIISAYLVGADSVFSQLRNQILF